jgi:hypothetical protein
MSDSESNTSVMIPMVESDHQQDSMYLHIWDTGGNGQKYDIVLRTPAQPDADNGGITLRLCAARHGLLASSTMTCCTDCTLIL